MSGDIPRVFESAIPERSRQGMGAALGLDGFIQPALWTHGEQHELLVRDLESERIEAARVRLQQERDAKASEGTP